jgi:16S rRNA (guanine527-N7)-methyltransferase
MKLLAEALEDMGLDHSEEILSKFQRYMERILEWNENVNLTSITDKDEFMIKHYVDSVSLCGFPQIKEAQCIIDVGTGAGFPGIPLAILFPEKRFLLMDSLNKRIRIIEELSREIGLKNVEFLHGRAEETAHDRNYRERFDLCVSRAVAHLSVLSEYCLPFVKVGGWFAAYKTGAAEEELEESRRAVSLLGGVPEEIGKPYIRRYGRDHRIIFIKKIHKTLAKYPRKPGTPAKEPLK